jgi:hypothetical protein
LDEIIKNRLDFTFPLPNVQVMTNMQRSNWYGSDGMSKAYDFYAKNSYGIKVVQEEERRLEIKAQRVLDNKAKKRARNQNTSEENKILNRFSPGPSGPSTQKRPRDATHVNDTPPRKRGRHNGDDSSDDEEIDDTAQKGKGTRKGKGKEVIDLDDMDVSPRTSQSPPP